MIFFNRIVLIRDILEKVSSIGNRIDVIGLTPKEFSNQLQHESKLSQSLSKGFKIIYGESEWSKIRDLLKDGERISEED